MTLKDCIKRLDERIIDRDPALFLAGQKTIQAYLAANEVNYARPVIVVGGTNGKGSCVATLSQIYTQAGYQVGAYTSPHLSKLNERFLLNQNPIDDHSLAAMLTKILDDEQLVDLSYFEVLTLAAWMLWISIDTDLMIFEVGMGGRLDATNALPMTASILTSVGLDHTEELGHTRSTIALEKVAIARPNQPMVVAEPDLPQSAHDWLEETGAYVYQNGVAYETHLLDQNLVWTMDDQDIHLPRPRLHQQSVGAAITMVHLLQDKLPVAEHVVAKAVGDAGLIGRFECVNETQGIWVDVAHNAPAVEYLINHWPFAWEASCCLVAFKRDKDWRSMCKHIKGLTKNLFVTDLGVPGLVSADELCEALGIDTAYQVDAEDISGFLDGLTEKTLVFGCFTLVAKVRSVFEENICWQPNAIGEDDAQ